MSEYLEKIKKSKNVVNYSDVKYSDSDLNKDYEFPGFYIGEKIVSFPEYNIGDIVFVKKYKYSDQSIGNNHLFVIVDTDNHAVPIENFCMLISSNLSKLKFETNIYLQKDKNNNLKKDSIVKTDKIYKFKSEEVSYKVGFINKNIVEKYKKLYLEWKEKNG